MQKPKILEEHFSFGNLFHIVIVMVASVPLASILILLALVVLKKLGVDK